MLCTPSGTVVGGKWAMASFAHNLPKLGAFATWLKLFMFLNYHLLEGCKYGDCQKHFSFSHAIVPLCTPLVCYAKYGYCNLIYGNPP